MGLVTVFVFLQVKLFSPNATKLNPHNTHITYLHLSDCPIANDFLQLVEKEVAQNKDVKTYLSRSYKNITDDMIVKRITDVYYLYFTKESHKSSELFISYIIFLLKNLNIKTVAL